MENEDGLQPGASKRSLNDSFRNAIQKFVSKAEEGGNNIFTISQMSDEFQIQRRRIYDILNVFESIGLCVKTNADTVTWKGCSNIPKTFIQYQKNYMVTIADVPISRIILSTKCISMNQLTTSLILCFLALQTPTLDIKQVAYFLSRENNRFKTTLCKLYQISHILDSIGILKRSEKSGEIELNQAYSIILPVISSNVNLVEGPFSIDSLLNRPVINIENIIKQRRIDFVLCAKQNQLQLFLSDPSLALSKHAI